MNKSWYKPAEKKDPNTMDVNALTFEERQTLMEQGKCSRCRKTGHRATDEADRKGKKKEEHQKLTW